MGITYNKRIIPFDPADPRVLARIKKASASNKRDFARSKASAVRALVRDGVLTKTGRIAKHYR